MLRKGLVRSIQQRAVQNGLPWQDFKVSESDKFLIEYIPLANDCWLQVSYSETATHQLTAFVNPAQRALWIKSAPHPSGTKMGDTSVRGHDEAELLTVIYHWLDLLSSEVRAHQELSEVRGHQDTVAALVNELEEKHGALPDEPHSADEIPDVMATLAEIRTRLEAEIRSREESTEKVEEELRALRVRMSKLESAVGFYSKKHVLTTIMSILVWFGKNADDLKKLGQVVAGLLP